MPVKNNPRFILAVILLTAAVFAAGCGKKNVRKPDAGSQFQPEPAVEVTEGSTSEKAEDTLQRNSYAPSAELRPVYFDYDRSGLTEEARLTMQANAAAINKMSAPEVQIAGHCDERGTTAYNLSLGQSRANAVRDYYRMLGVKPEAMSVISYGEESPVCPESTDACWAKNRRVETLLKVK